MYMYYLEVAFRLLLASILGGIIGAERESENKNAGFRTHMLVCIASTLVMVTSEYIFKKYAGHTNIDPARLGAQVISGIGFLGAGAIIRDGFEVRGLTTAASLWAVACIGLACGIGFYEGALLATFIILIVLLLLKSVREKFKSDVNLDVIITKADTPGHIGEIESVLDNNNINIKSLNVVPLDSNELTKIELTLSLKHAKDLDESVLSQIKNLKGVINVKHVN